MLRDPCILGDPQTNGDKIRSRYLTLAFSGAKRGQNCYVSPAFSGSPMKKSENHNWLPHPAFSGAHKWAELLRKPCVFGGPQCQVPAEKGYKVATSDLVPICLGIPKNALVT